jgi:hypothetical protein
VNENNFFKLKKKRKKRTATMQNAPYGLTDLGDNFFQKKPKIDRKHPKTQPPVILATNSTIDPNITDLINKLIKGQVQGHVFK